MCYQIRLRKLIPYVPIETTSYTMEEVQAIDYVYIRDDLFKANDEKIMTDYLMNMIEYGDTWPDHIPEDTDVFNKNPSTVFDSGNPTFVVVKPREEACGKSDGCDSGCWRIMGRDKLIKDEDTGKLLGFKKIFKFCGKTKPRDYKRTWVMEEYRLKRKWNPKQDHVICKIRLLFQTEISFLLAKHFSYSSDMLLVTQSLPAYGFSFPDPQDDDIQYLLRIVDSDGEKWPSYVTNDVYCVHPSTLVDPYDEMFCNYGLCIFANRTVASGISDGCASGCWRIMDPDKLIEWETMTIGMKTVFRFCEEEPRYTCNGEGANVTWTMEEYRLAEREMQFKVICVIKMKFSIIEGEAV